MITFRFIAVLIGIVLSIILGEIFLRGVIQFELFGQDNGFTMFMKQLETSNTETFQTIERTGLFRPSDDKTLGWEPIPGAKTNNIRINSSGFRDDEYTMSGDKGKIRIIFLGDSETFGLRLKKEETVPEFLEHHLNAISGSNRYEVLNFGVPGYNTAQEFAILRQKAILFHPSIVVMYYVLNDPLIANPVIFLKGGILSHSYLYMALNYFSKSRLMLDEIQHGSQSVEVMYQRLHSSAYFDAVKKVIGEMGDFLSQRDIRFILVIAPEVYGFESWVFYPYSNINIKLKQLASETLEVIDPLDSSELQKHHPKEFWSTTYDCHKNAIANNIIGAYIARHIIKN